MLFDFSTWASSILNDYQKFFGHYSESESDSGKMYLVIQARGSAAVDVDTRRPRFRVLLVGRRNNRSDALKLINDLESLIAESINASSSPACAATVRCLSELTGPGYTSENRAFVECDFEVVY